MKLFDILSVHPRIGPYITMAGKMVPVLHSYQLINILEAITSFIGTCNVVHCCHAGSYRIILKIICFHCQDGSVDGFRGMDANIWLIIFYGIKIFLLITN